jgi:hypothetical protein
MNSFGISGGAGSKKEDEKGTGNGSMPKAEAKDLILNKHRRMALARNRMLILSCIAPLGRPF